MALEAAFDEVIHAPVRLRLCGLMRHVDQIEFAVLRDTLSITDASLSKHLKLLQQAGYVAMTKTRSVAVPGRCPPAHLGPSDPDRPPRVRRAHGADPAYRGRVHR